MPPRASAPPKLLPPAERFRLEIQKAKAEGVPVSDLLLQLTLGDTAKLKRDPSIPTEDLAFAAGEIHYLGVKIAEGGVEASALVFLRP